MRLASTLATDVVLPHQPFELTISDIADIVEFFPDVDHSLGLKGNIFMLSNMVKAIAVRKLLTETYNGFFPFEDIVTPKKLFEQIDKKKIFVFFFVYENEVIGTASVVPNGYGGAEFGRTAVRRKYWGKGIGDLLLNARYTFTKLYSDRMNIKWFYCSARAANRRIQEIWFHSPHRLAIVGLAPYYELGVQEFSTIFIKHFSRPDKYQLVEMIPEAENLVEAVVAQFSRGMEIVKCSGKEEKVNCPKNSTDFFCKVYVDNSDWTLKDMPKHKTDYEEVLVPTILKGSAIIQRHLIDNGFIPTAFFPAFNSFPPFISFGRLKPGKAIRAAYFPKDVLSFPIGQELCKICDFFSNGREVEEGDPFAK